MAWHTLRTFCARVWGECGMRDVSLRLLFCLFRARKLGNSGIWIVRCSKGVSERVVVEASIL